MALIHATYPVHKSQLGHLTGRAGKQNLQTKQKQKNQIRWVANSALT
jgi:hypothetical protein